MKKLLSLGLALCSLLISALPAQAHAQLISANPKVSAVLYKMPTSVTLTFDDDLLTIGNANQLQVFNEKNQRIDTGVTKTSGATISTSINAKFLAGKYRVIYRALSADGHPVSANYYFYLKKK